jgi:hypothetical protein
MNLIALNKKLEHFVGFSVNDEWIYFFPKGEYLKDKKIHSSMYDQCRQPFIATYLGNIMSFSKSGVRHYCIGTMASEFSDCMKLDDFISDINIILKEDVSLCPKHTLEKILSVWHKED